jgi:spore coat polysaccharide biosynthesis protein SpsF (cytidylyltransferase family)
MESLEADIVFRVHGDEPMTYPEMIENSISR